MGRVVAVAVGERSGLRKRSVEVGRLVADHGLEGDRHAGPGPRQVSLLDARVGELLGSLGIVVEPGDLGENLLLADVPLGDLQPGARLRVGGAVIEITEVRRPCRLVREVDPRALKALVGHAGQMARVVSSGDIRPGDSAEPLDA